MATTIGNLQMNVPRELVYVIGDWDEHSLRGGIASFHGQCHLFHSEWKDVDPASADSFILLPLEAGCFSGFRRDLLLSTVSVTEHQLNEMTLAPYEEDLCIEPKRFRDLWRSFVDETFSRSTSGIRAAGDFQECEIAQGATGLPLSRTRMEVHWSVLAGDGVGHEELTSLLGVIHRFWRPSSTAPGHDLGPREEDPPIPW
jgi:hypothetical protein